MVTVKDIDFHKSFYNIQFSKYWEQYKAETGTRKGWSFGNEETHDFAKWLAVMVDSAPCTECVNDTNPPNYEKCDKCKRAYDDLFERKEK